MIWFVKTNRRATLSSCAPAYFCKEKNCISRGVRHMQVMVSHIGATILHPNTKVLEFQGLFVFLGVKNTPLSPLHLFLNLMDLNLRLYRTFEKSLLFWYNIVRKKESEDTQMKNGYTMVRRLKLTPFEIRVAIEALNVKRLNQKAHGIDNRETSNLILHLLDALEA